MSQAVQNRAFDPVSPFFRAEAHAAGMSSGELLSGRFHKVFHGIYVSASVPITGRVRAQAALRVMPKASHLSHHTTHPVSVKRTRSRRLAEAVQARISATLSWSRVVRSARLAPHLAVVLANGWISGTDGTTFRIVLANGDGRDRAGQSKELERDARLLRCIARSGPVLVAAGDQQNPNSSDWSGMSRPDRSWPIRPSRLRDVAATCITIRSATSWPSGGVRSAGH